MPTLDRERLDSIVSAICDRLDGEWLVIGGAVVALCFEADRKTEDVDVIGLQGSPAERMALLSLAHDLGLPVESMNSAADFFVHRVPDWRSELQLLRKGAKGTVYRPTATLLLVLKLRRLDERDLADCRAVIASGEPFDRKRVKAEIEALAPAPDETAAARRKEFLALVSP